MTAKKSWKNGFCRACGQRRTEDGHDPCIANLPGVLYACCGHGVEGGYIKFEDGRCLNFKPVEVDLDRPTRTSDGVPVFVLGGSRVYNYEEKKVKLKGYPTNIMKRSQ